ncbi:peptide-methionine (S)-S-oxide reductase MsrA [soil metagenome]
MSRQTFLSLIVVPFLLAACGASGGNDHLPPASTAKQTTMTTPSSAKATFGGGCFWCTEAVFQLLDGVLKVESGYSGGSVKNPTYKAVCTGTTGHAEVTQITYDPSVVTYDDLLQVFFASHDPTTLNRQGNDAGTQYRSVIFTHDAEQERIAKAYIDQLTKSKTWSDPIVTEVSPITTFYVAEDYHQDYYNQNGSQPYCSFVVRPKVEKFLKLFPEKVKPSYKQ